MKREHPSDGDAGPRAKRPRTPSPQPRDVVQLPSPLKRPGLPAPLGRDVLADDPQMVTPQIFREMERSLGADVAIAMSRQWPKVRTRVLERNNLMEVRQVRIRATGPQVSEELRQIARAIFNQQRWQFRIDVGFGTANMEKNSDEVLIRYAEKNSRLFERKAGGPKTISTLSDMDQLMKEFDIHGLARVSTSYH